MDVRSLAADERTLMFGPYGIGGRERPEAAAESMMP
jgi:hypothetical protein